MIEDGFTAEQIIFMAKLGYEIQMRGTPSAIGGGEWLSSGMNDEITFRQDLKELMERMRDSTLTYRIKPLDEEESTT